MRYSFTLVIIASIVSVFYGTGLTKFLFSAVGLRHDIRVDTYYVFVKSNTESVFTITILAICLFMSFTSNSPYIGTIDEDNLQGNNK